MRALQLVVVSILWSEASNPGITLYGCAFALAWRLDPCSGVICALNACIIARQPVESLSDDNRSTQCEKLSLLMNASGTVLSCCHHSMMLLIAWL